MSFEEEFRIKISDHDAKHIYTVGDARDCIVRLMQIKAGESASIDPEAVLLRIREITADQTGFKLEHIALDARFVENLGMD